MLIVACTDGFLTGVHAGDVRAVIVFGGARSILDFWKAAGRAGRDDGGSSGKRLYNEAHLCRGNGGEETSGNGKRAVAVQKMGGGENLLQKTFY